MTAVLKKKTALTSQKTENLTTAQALIHFLARQQVEQFDGSISPLFGGVFGIFGHGNVSGIGEALWSYRHDLTYYRGNNEQGMAHAAIAYAKVNRCRKVMAVTTSIGPGATNLVTPAALAHINRLPVLFLPGDSYASRRPDPVLQQLEDEKCPFHSVNDCLQPVSRYFDRITRPEQLLDSLPKAIHTLLDPLTRGPVTLALPQDVQAEEYSFPDYFFEERIYRIHRPQPDQRSINEAVELIKDSQNPLMIVGGGVHYSGAEEVLKDFVEKFGIPIVETQAGKGSLPWDHQNNLGAIGVTGTSAANQMAREADLIICLGTRLSDFTTASKSLFHRPEVAMIGINISSYDAYKNNGLAVVGDILITLKELGNQLINYHVNDDYLRRYHRAQDEWEKIHREVTNAKEQPPIDAQVLAAVNEIVDEKAIVVCAAGGLPGELHKLWKTQDILGYHVEYGFSCMGYEIAGGLGVKMAHPDREVYVLVGDGSYLMLHSELLTALQLGYKINVVLLDNFGFGCIHRLQTKLGSEPYGNLFSEQQVDFVQNARSYGCYAQKVDNIQELKEQLIQNKKINIPCVTVINTDPYQGTPGTAWWDVAVAETSQSQDIRRAREEYENNLSRL